MSYHIQLTAQVEADIERIIDWLATRSPEGASRWYQSLYAKGTSTIAQVRGYAFSPRGRRWPGGPDEGEHVRVAARDTLTRTSSTLPRSRGRVVSCPLPSRKPGRSAVEPTTPNLPRLAGVNELSGPGPGGVRD